MSETAKSVGAGVGRVGAGIAAALLMLAAGCAPNSTPFRLEELRGRVIDSATGAPIVGAQVVEWYVGGGLSDRVRPVHHERWATSDAAGVFVLGEARASATMLAGATYGPKFAFVHPDYGLQRQAREENEGWVLRGDRARVEQARTDLQAHCRAPHDDDAARRIREVACKRTPSRNE